MVYYFLDLRLIVASATLDAEKFQRFFNNNTTDDPANDNAAILTVEGRMYPVDVHHSLDPVADYIKSAVETIMKIHQYEKEGDVLCFMTGQEDVQQVCGGGGGGVLGMGGKA